MKSMKKTFISSAYIYPICPLNINHARMFIIGDIIARYSRSRGIDVFFPIASHYSGNTAQHISETFTKIFSNKGTATEEEKRVFNLYRNIYSVPTAALKSFTNALNILDFYNQEILWELKSLDVSGDYEYFYTTKHKDFSVFINTIISLYEKSGLLIYNTNKELALDYDDTKWKEKTLNLLNQTEFIQPFHKNNIASAMKNVRSDWNLLREDGFGVNYGEKWIVDPMFDSELFTLFDLYIRFKKEYGGKMLNTYDIFENLFDVLRHQEKSKSVLVNKIIDWLPCDVFVCEEHLKNWVIKKLYAESLLLDKKYQTKKYFVLGMGLLNGKRMSASRGTAILANNLINSYGSTKARLIILLGGGHPSKTYDYDESLPTQVDKLLNNFTNYYLYLVSLADKEIRTSTIDDTKNGELTFETIHDTIERNISKGYYRQAIIELLSIVPKKYGSPTSKMAGLLISLYGKYLGILLPSLLNNLATTKNIKILEVKDHEKIH